ncbi:tetratricopeptide repeat protein, partial [Singulisphaera rosea]
MKGPSTGAALREAAERSIRKGQFKDAVKEAKICFKDEASEANRRLLERAYLLRAQQLNKGGMPTSAIEVAGHLLEFGVTDPALVEDAVKLFLAVGMSKAAQSLQG